MYFNVSGEVSWWRLQDMLTTKNLLFYSLEESYTSEQKILNASICLFQLFGKIKIAGSYEDKLLRALRKLRRRLSFVSIHRNNALI